MCTINNVTKLDKTAKLFKQIAKYKTISEH